MVSDSSKRIVFYFGYFGYEISSDTSDSGSFFDGVSTPLELLPLFEYSRLILSLPKNVNDSTLQCS